MIKEVIEVSRGDANVEQREFKVNTEKSFSLATVIGFIKYQLGSALFQVEPVRILWNDEYCVYMIQNNDGTQIGTVRCYVNENKFHVSYSQSSLFTSRLRIRHAF